MSEDLIKSKNELNSTTKEELLQKIDKSIIKEKDNKARNSMGCSESIYNAYYDITCLFTEKELNEMSKKELVNIIFSIDIVTSMLY